MNEKLKELRAKSMKLPLTPGVYIMRDKSDKIIYIGKAKALKNRVSQYFGSQNGHSTKVRRMVENVDRFDYILTDSEYEALVLECSLIKQNRPKYNILLKDEKGYHYIKITNEDYPRIMEAKRVDSDGAKYLGPYVSSFAVKQAVDSVVKAFALPTCGRKFPRDIKKGRPCLNYHIKQCMAPCTGKISRAEYNEIFDSAVRFLQGGSGDVAEKLKEQMFAAAEAMEFEKAARLRDRINAIEKMSEEQKVVMSPIAEHDIIAAARSGSFGAFKVFRFTGGKLSDSESFYIDEIGELPEARFGFVQQYYSMRDRIPPRIDIDGETEDMELLQRWLSEKAGRAVKIHLPQRGEQAHLMDMCRQNAAEYLDRQLRESGINEPLQQLGALLGIPAPMYIEAYDISNTAGAENVAGMVVFYDGQPLKSAYKRFKIKSFSGQDDYASMHEVLSRRIEEYRKHKGEESGFGKKPDLILLDGGKGQVSAVAPLIGGDFDVPLFGMVKDGKHRTRAIATNGGELELLKSRKAFALVGRIQEEVHRYAIGYHRQRRAGRTFSSSLTEIDGIGEQRAKALLKSFKTISAIKEATEQQLAGVKGMNAAAAKAVYNYYHGE
ncbi:MAG: excinuclease ABC subunit UvrC [Clostridia bacterium]|nr:excinuclease ABC subunit UvrC [Clostridia bacterium]